MVNTTWLMLRHSAKWPTVQLRSYRFESGTGYFFFFFFFFFNFLLMALFLFITEETIRAIYDDHYTNQI